MGEQLVSAPPSHWCGLCRKLRGRTPEDRGQPPPALSGSVGEAQLLPVAPGSGFSAGHPPPDAAEMAVPSCRLLPGFWSCRLGRWGPAEGCLTQD